MTNETTTAPENEPEAPKAPETPQIPQVPTAENTAAYAEGPVRMTSGSVYTPGETTTSN